MLGLMLPSPACGSLPMTAHAEALCGNHQKGVATAKHILFLILLDWRFKEYLLTVVINNCIEPIYKSLQIDAVSCVFTFDAACVSGYNQLFIILELFEQYPTILTHSMRHNPWWLCHVITEWHGGHRWPRTIQSISRQCDPADPQNDPVACFLCGWVVSERQSSVTVSVVVFVLSVFVSVFGVCIYC